MSRWFSKDKQWCVSGELFGYALYKLDCFEGTAEDRIGRYSHVGVTESHTNAQKFLETGELPEDVIHIWGKVPEE